MEPTRANRLERYVKAIRDSGLSIYDTIEIGHPELWVPAQDLEDLLNHSLRGLSLTGLPLRTRSKVVKSGICKALGYRVPKSFRRTRPRFPGQLFDTYVQKSRNLQIWNEEISTTRRYVVVQVSPDDTILCVKVAAGDILGRFDTTGTLTQKYQARLTPGTSDTELICVEDTERLKPFVRDKVRRSLLSSPVDYPVAGRLISVKGILALRYCVWVMSFCGVWYTH